MKRWIVAAALLALSAGAALGQTVGQDGQRVAGPNNNASGPPAVEIVGGVVRADTTIKGLTLDASGNLLIKEQAPLASSNVTYTSIIANASLAYNAGDSSAVLSVAGLRHMKLLIKAVPLGLALDTTSVVRLVFQIRTHLNGLSDSSSVFPEYAYGVTPLGVAVGAADSATVGHLLKGGRNVAWSGEFVVQASSTRTAHASAVALNGHDWYYPSGLSLPLDNLMGRDFWADYMSVRVRNITGTACAVTVSLVGTGL